MQKKNIIEKLQRQRSEFGGFMYFNTDPEDGAAEQLPFSSFWDLENKN